MKITAVKTHRTWPSVVAISALSLVGLSCDDGTQDGHAGRELPRWGAAADELPVLATLPEFSFISQSGDSFGSAELKGHTWIANFIFTRCVMSCPMQTARMAELQEPLRGHARWNEISMVSFSVDPEYDTPQVLRSYAEQYGADGGHWKFLTGAREDIWQLSKKGFKLPVAEEQMEVGLPLFHSSMLVLVDGQQQIRGYYDGLGAEGLEKIRNDLDRILIR